VKPSGLYGGGNSAPCYAHLTAGSVTGRVLRMPKEDPYAAVAALYDAMLPENPERTAFFANLFRSHNVQSVLDCACGTGNDLLLFHRLGCQVSGSDLSDSMLEVAEQKLQQARVALPLRKADFQQLTQHFSERFDAVVCLSNAINEEEVDVNMALDSMRAVLKPKGIIVFDQGQTDCSLKDPPRFAPIVNNEDMSRLFTMDYQGDIMTVRIFDFVHQGRKRRYEFHHSEHRIRLRRYADWAAILSSRSMEGEYFGSWQGDLFDPQRSMRLIIVARPARE
jgi:glycine/sarcosine N-methyltransferase